MSNHFYVVNFMDSDRGNKNSSRILKFDELATWDESSNQNELIRCRPFGNILISCTSVSSAYNLNGRLSRLSVSQRAAVRDNTLYPDHHLRHRILPNVFSHLCEHLMLIMKDKKNLFVVHAFFGICSTSSICQTSMPK